MTQWNRGRAVRAFGMVFAAWCGVATIGGASAQATAGADLSAQLNAHAAAAGAPKYVVDPSWPKDLPNNWIIGQVGGLTVDKHNHVWVNQRPRSNTADELGADPKNGPRSQCCIAAPSVMEFDQKGNLLQAWGGPGYVPEWPNSEHGIWVDQEDNVWIGGNAAGDRAILKFTNSGKLLLVIGKPNDTSPQNNQDVTRLGQPAAVEVDDKAHEVYIADGYLNKRVVVYDSRTGAYKRGWGAYGQSLATIDNGTPPPYANTGAAAPQFRNPVHCARLSDDGYVYVCDRVNNRIQVFTKNGQFLKEFFIRPSTLGNGSVWQLDFSSDPGQKYLLVADGENNVVWEVRRSDGLVATSFGRNGRNAGEFHWIHQVGITTDGNFYTGEVDTGKRIQKFVLKGGPSDPNR